MIAGLHSLAASNLGGEEAPDEDTLVCGDDADAKELVLELAGKLTPGRAIDAGPLASARALEGMTAVIINVNKRYKAHAGLRVTGSAADVTTEVRVIGLEGVPELEAGDDLGRLLAEACERAGGLEPRRRRRRRTEGGLQGGGANRAARRDRAVGARASSSRARRATRGRWR